MYSQEERVTAVHAYINSNFNENYVIRPLGYPSPNALRSWYKEYKATGTLHEKSRPKPRYAHQGGSNPPVIVVHGNALEDIGEAYRRYLEGCFREKFNLAGTPLRIEFRTKENPFVKEEKR